MGRKRQDLKTYGRHRQRVVTTIDELKAKEKHYRIFSNSGSSDHLFSSSSSSSSNLWDVSNESVGSCKENKQENQFFRKTRGSKFEISSSSNESSSYDRQRNAKRKALKDIKNGDVAGRELDQRLNRRKKWMCNTNKKEDLDAISAKGISNTELEGCIVSKRKDSVINFSEFEDYSLIISDSLEIDDENSLDLKGKLKRAHSTPASNGLRGKKSRCTSSIDSSTPFCKRSVHQVSTESLKDSNLSHIRSYERTCESDNIFDYSDMNSMTKDGKEKLSLASESLQKLHQSSLLFSENSPKVTSLRNGKSFHHHSSKHNSLNSNKSHSYLFSKSRSSLQSCRVDLQPLRDSLLQLFVENDNSRTSSTPAKNSTCQNSFNTSDSLFSSCPNSLNDKSSGKSFVAERSTRSDVSYIPENKTGRSNQSECDCDSESDHLKSHQNSDSDEEENSEESEHSEESNSDTELTQGEPSRMSLRNSRPRGSQKIRLSGTSKLDFSNTCYSLTEEGDMNDWSTDDVTDQLANVSLDDKGNDISDQSDYSSAQSHLSTLTESDELERGQSSNYSSHHTLDQSMDSDEDLCSQSGGLSPAGNAIEKLQKSFSEMLTPCKKSKGRKILSPRSKILLQCEQTDFVPFSKCIPPNILSSCVKIGEGVYGEVFRPNLCDPVAFKVIPIEGDFTVNDEAQKTFEEILPEIIISRELSALRVTKDNTTDNFVAVNRVSCVQGCYPRELLEQWDEYDRAHGSENDRPEKFDDSQLFIMFEFADGGCDLESFKFKNILEVKSVIVQVALALAVAEIEMEFEHRDLHWGNVLVRRSSQETVIYCLQDSEHEIQAHGIHISIIDFTLSRLTKEGCTVFCDLSTDDTLFEGKGDYQFDVYRLMKEENGNNWEPFNPHTNILWLHYLLDKLTTKKPCTVRSKAHKDIQRELRMVKKSMLDYQSAYDLIANSDFFQS